ncbi:MAG: sensor histidine kinase, partial [Haloarculaceae archaeon]
LRNELTVIRGQADHVASAGDGDRADAAETIVAAADRLIALSEHVGRLHRLDETIASRDVSDCVARVVEQAREEYPAATVVVDAPASARVQAVALLEDAIREAVENAIVHADDPEPTVSVTVSDGAETGYVRVSIADTGPGIPDREWEPVESGAERALAHGSGLGLWVMQWAASRSGGRLSRTDREPTGTTVIFELPKTTDPSGTRPAAVAALSRATSAAPPRETATGDGAAGDGRQDRPT